MATGTQLEVVQFRTSKPPVHEPSNIQVAIFLAILCFSTVHVCSLTACPARVRVMN